MFASLTLLVACNPSGASNNPDAGKYDDYYSEKPTGDEQASGDTAGDGVTDSGYDPSLYEDVPSITDPQKKQKRRKGKIDKKKQARKAKKKKNRKNKKQKNKFAVALDGVLPTAAEKGSLIEIFGSGLDQKDLVVQIGGKEQKIVEASEERLLVKLNKGGNGPVQLGKTNDKGKFQSFAKTDMKFETLPKGGFGVRKNADNGLVASIYDIGSEVSELPQFEGEPVAVIGVDQLNLKTDDLAGVAGKNEWFGAHFRGSLNIVQGGSYQFCMVADDGAQLYLDEGLVLDADGVHEAKEVCETFEVEAGEYQLDLIWFQAASGPAALQLFWAKDGGAKEIIPASAFFPPDDAADMARG
jgi:hypothetical protein